MKNLDVNLAVNNLLQRDDEGDDEPTDDEDAYMHGGMRRPFMNCDLRFLLLFYVSISMTNSNSNSTHNHRRSHLSARHQLVGSGSSSSCSGRGQRQRRSAAGGRGRRRQQRRGRVSNHASLLLTPHVSHNDNDCNNDKHKWHGDQSHISAPPPSSSFVVVVVVVHTYSHCSIRFLLFLLLSSERSLVA